MFERAHVEMCTLAFQTLAVELRQLMVAEVSLFQVAKGPTNTCDYTLPVFSTVSKYIKKERET